MGVSSWVVHVIIGYRAESGVDGLRELAINSEGRESFYTITKTFTSDDSYQMTHRTR